MKKLLLILLMLCGHAFAASPSTYYRAGGSSADPVDAWKTTQDAACKYANAAWFAKLDGNPAVYKCFQTVSVNYAPWTADQFRADIYTMQRCDDGTLPNSGVCADPPPTCTAGRYFESWYSYGVEGPDGFPTRKDFPQNVGGCAVANPKLVDCRKVVATGEVRCLVGLTETGLEGSGSPSSTADSPSGEKPTVSPPFAGDPDTGGCPAGTARIGTDSAGTPICAGQGTSPGQPSPPPTTTKPPVTTTNPDGSTTKTEVTERANSDGSTTTTTKTTVTAADGTQTVSENTATGNTPSGGKGSADATKEEQSDFCKKNPQLTVCRNSTVSGSCEQITCEGDAITCEIARQTAKANCKHQEEIDALNDSPLKTLGDDVIAGNDPQKGQFPTAANGQNVNIGTNLDSTGFLTSSGACFDDVPFTAGGQQFVLPFSSVCDSLEPLRYAMLVIGALLSMKLLRSSIFA